MISISNMHEVQMVYSSNEEEYLCVLPVGDELNLYRLGLSQMRQLFPVIRPFVDRIDPCGDVVLSVNGFLPENLIKGLDLYGNKQIIGKVSEDAS